jgi:hypothetical protein
MVCAAFVDVSVSLGGRDRKLRSEDRESLETSARTEDSRKAEGKKGGYMKSRGRVCAHSYCVCFRKGQVVEDNGTGFGIVSKSDLQADGTI